jgi:hypothetical protein
MLHEQRRIGFGGPTELGTHTARALNKAAEEHVFVNEPAVSAAPLHIKDASPFDHFPDEEYGKDPVAQTSDRSPIRLFDVKMAAGETPIAEKVATFGGVRPALLLLFFLAAALTAFGTVRACQVNGISGVRLWEMIGR